MIVRRARPEDVPAVAEFTRNTWEWGDYVHREFPGWVSDGTAYVAELDGVVVAAARMLVVGGTAYFQGLRVRPEYRRRGVGRAVTEHLIDEARSAGASLATLIVAEWNKPSISLVQKVGFEPVLELWGGVPERAEPSRCLEGREAEEALEEALGRTGGFACLPDDPWICVRATAGLLLERARPCVGDGLYVGRFSFGSARVDSQGDVTALRPEGFAKLYGKYILFAYRL
ncbi:MAG: GNAT family N-acetyltransferase [Thermoproteus sp.]|jgi:GNAT superfamily N-acetyltransferase